MKMNRYKIQFICVTLAFWINGTIAWSSEPVFVKWNESAQSQVMNSNELAKLGEVFPNWKIKQVVWPLTAEIESHRVVVDPNTITSCIDWLTKFMAENQLPANLNEKLVAMEEWGVIRKESEQERLCDVFITRFKKDPYVIHIQESPYNVVITVADDRFVASNKTDYEKMIRDTAMLVLKEQLKPDANSDFHLFELKDTKLSRAVWLTRGVATTDKDGKKCGNLINASKNGAASVEAETDGRFVRFEIVKCAGAFKRSSFDPYIKRFAPSPDEPEQQPEKPDYNTLRDSLPRGGLPPTDD
jgi:hypothetical protein